MNNKALAHIGLFVANLIYAINYSFAKDVMPHYIEPSGFILLRVIGAVLLFGLSYFLFVKEKVCRNDILLFAICGLFGVAINQLLFFEGLNLTTPINAAIIMTLNPILVIILSVIILKEKITDLKITGAFLGFIGAIILILNGGNFNTNVDFMKGNLFIMINATSYALYLVLVKPLMQKYHPITVMSLIFSFGLLYVIPFGVSQLANIDWDIIPFKIMMEIGFVVLCTTFIAYLFNSSALKYLNASTVSIYIYLQPLLAGIIALLLQSDSIDLVKIIASLFIFIGVYLVSIQSESSSSTHNVS